ncbi:uncharacterized protein GJ701_003602 isoform 1-T10 [Geothlypis trichas]
MQTAADPGRRSRAPGLPWPSRLRLRLLQGSATAPHKMAAPMEAAAPFCARQSLSTNTDLAEAEEQKAAARSRYGARREESGGFHRPPAAERRLWSARVGGREEREEKGDASSERVRGCVIPARNCRSCGAGEGKAKAKAGGLGAALAGA